MEATGATAGASGPNDGRDPADRATTHPLLVQWSFSAQADAPSSARALISSALDGSCPQVDVLLLMVSELVTNAVMHTHQGAELRLIDLGPVGLRVEVEDLDAHLPAQRAHPGAEGGFGLRIIDSFARSWGTSLVDDPDGSHRGKVVWFEIDRA